MANIHPDIKPNGLNQKELISLAVMLLRSLQGIAAKLDDDGGVTDTTYEANAITALISLSGQDHIGNRFSNEATMSSTIESHHILEPTGYSAPAMLAFLYQFTNAFETLCEQLDNDGGITATTFEANAFTAMFLHIIENEKGNQLGNGTAYYFRPGGVKPDNELVEWFYNAINAIETLTEQLDADGDVTDTNYEALWFTATILMRVENSQGNVLGNDPKDQ
jgi:hypothetical protein